ncbi:MAG: hypothetical protein IJN86_04500 [Clostridia bacterium]|nr:hypothetical protein [Clostridia bacterium]
MKGLVYAVLKRFIYSLLILILVLTALPAFSVSASVDAATVQEMLASTEGLVFSGEYMDLNYRRYDSLTYNKADFSVKASLIVYFHDEAGKGNDNKAQIEENGILSQLLCENTANAWSNFRYVIIAPQCPAGESFTATNGKDYSFAPNATPVLSTVKALVDEISENEPIMVERVVLIGVGTGATAAYDYVCRYPTNVSRVMAVGGYCDPEKLGTAEMGRDRFFRIVSPKGEDSHAVAVNLVKSFNKNGSKSGTEFLTFDGKLDNAVKEVLNYNEPSIAEWAISENYSAKKLNVVSSAGKGGTISPPSTQISYNGSITFVIKQEDGYKISKLTVNGTEIDLEELKVNKTNSNTFNYTLSDITEDKNVEVEFTPTTAATESPYNAVIIKTLKWSLYIAAMLLFAGAVIFLIDRLLAKKANGK